MALPDPIPTITVNSVAYDFARVGMSDSRAVYQTADGLDVLTIENTVKNRNRTLVRLDRKKIAADPFNADLNQAYTFATYVVIDKPTLGVSASEVNLHGQLLDAILVAGTPDYRLRVLQGEV
jgi:hypothetical protein